MVILYAHHNDDDRARFVEIVRRIDSSYTVLQATDGIDALKVLSGSDTVPPDLIFLDINMPAMDGFETLIEIRKDKRYRKITIILYSTNGMPKVQDNYESFNVKFLKKSNSVHDEVKNVRSSILANTYISS